MAEGVTKDILLQAFARMPISCTLETALRFSRKLKVSYTQMYCCAEQLVKEGILSKKLPPNSFRPCYELTTTGKQHSLCRKSKVLSAYERKMFNVTEEQEKILFKECLRTLQFLQSKKRPFASVLMIQVHLQRSIVDTLTILAELKKNNLVIPVCRQLLWKLTFSNDEQCTNIERSKKRKKQQCKVQEL